MAEDSAQDRISKDEVRHGGISLPVLLTTFVFSALLFLWWALDHSYPLWDAGSHVQDAIKYAGLIRHPHVFKAAYWHEFLTVSFNYPLTQHLIYGFSKYLFGFGRLSDALVNTLYMVVLCLSMAGLTRLAGGGVIAAVISIIVINGYPSVSQFSHTQMLDFGHITLSALALYGLCRWRDNKTWINTALMSLALALGATAKQAAASFLIVPCLLVFIGQVKTKNKGGILQLTAAGATTAGALLLWLLPNRQSLSAWREYYLPQVTQGGGHSPIQVFFEHLSSYITALPSLMSPFLLVLFAVCLILSVKTKYRPLSADTPLLPAANLNVSNLAMAAALSGIPLMCLLSMNNPESRYILPALIWPALFSAIVLEALWLGKLKSKSDPANNNRESGYPVPNTVMATIFVVVFQYTVINFCPYPIGMDANTMKSIKASVGIADELVGPPYSPVPPGDPYGQEWLIATVCENEPEQNKRITLNLLPSTKELSVHTLNVAFLQRSRQILISTFRRFTLHGDVFEYTPQEKDYYDWYLTKTGFNGKNLLDQKSEDNYKALQSTLQDQTQYSLIAQRKIEDGSLITLYRRKR